LSLLTRPNFWPLKLTALKYQFLAKFWPGRVSPFGKNDAAELLRMSGGFKRAAYQQAADLTSYSVIDVTTLIWSTAKIPIGRALAGEADTDVLLKPGDVLTITHTDHHPKKIQTTTIPTHGTSIGGGKRNISAEAITPVIAAVS